jgi:hypothetical protein
MIDVKLRMGITSLLKLAWLSIAKSWDVNQQEREALIFKSASKNI